MRLATFTSSLVLASVFVTVVASTGWVAPTAAAVTSHSDPDCSSSYAPLGNTGLSLCYAESERNPYTKSGCLSWARIRNDRTSQIHFKLVISRTEGGSQTWDWFLAPGGFYSWSIDTCRISDVQVSVL